MVLIEVGVGGAEQVGGGDAEGGGEGGGGAPLWTMLPAFEARDSCLGYPGGFGECQAGYACGVPVEAEHFRHFAAVERPEVCDAWLVVPIVVCVTAAHNSVLGEDGRLAAPRKGGDSGETAPLARALVPPPPAELGPSVALARWIAAVCRAAQRPGWLIATPDDAMSGPLGYDGALFVPRPPVCFRDGFLLDRAAGRDAEVLAPAIPRSYGITPLLVETLRTGNPRLKRLLGKHEQAAARRLWAAALRDIAALSIEGVGEACGYGSEDTAKKAVTRGRQAWRLLRAWPWVEFTSPGAAPPRSWRQEPFERGSAIDQSLRMWAGLPGWGGTDAVVPVADYFRSYPSDTE